MNAPKRSGAPLIGRRIGIALFWCMAVFVVGASSRSVLMELFDLPSVPSNDSAAPHCAAELRSLHQRLREQASAEVKLGRDPSRLQRWLVDWDRDFAETRDDCGSLKDTRRALRTLRERTESLLDRHSRDQLPLSEHIDRVLERFPPISQAPQSAVPNTVAPGHLSIAPARTQAAEGLVIRSRANSRET